MTAILCHAGTSEPGTACTQGLPWKNLGQQATLQPHHLPKDHNSTRWFTKRPHRHQDQRPCPKPQSRNDQLSEWWHSNPRRTSRSWLSHPALIRAQTTGTMFRKPHALPGKMLARRTRFAIQCCGSATGCMLVVQPNPTPQHLYIWSTGRGWSWQCHRSSTSCHQTQSMEAS